MDDWYRTTQQTIAASNAYSHAKLFQEHEKLKKRTKALVEAIEYFEEHKEGWASVRVVLSVLKRSL